MSLWRIPGAHGLERVPLRQQMGDYYRQRAVAVDRAAQEIYTKRDVVGPGRECWATAKRLRTVEAGIAMALAEVVVQEYEKGLPDVGQ